MKKYEELNHYEALEIPPGASPFEVSQAYKDALSIYNEDSLITYSFFDDDERDLILKKIEKAFLTLIDPIKRTTYDRKLVRSGEADESILIKKERKKPISLFQTKYPRNKGIHLKKIRKKIAAKDMKKLSNEIFSSDVISGTDLKNLRESVGIDLQEVFEVTRVNIPTLKSIEENEFDKLPPIIYLKNFLKSYSDIFQLDSTTIIDGYIKSMTIYG
jgi:DnaJ-class molecular chaperone